MLENDAGWVNAALRGGTIERVVAMGAEALPFMDRTLVLLTPVHGRVALDSNTAIVTAIAVLEALGAVDRLQTLARDVRPVAVAYASAALRRMGHAPPPREVPPGPSRDALIAQLATGKPKERELALACALRHADLALLPPIRAALNDSNAAVREEAARTCGRYADASCFDLLIERLRARPPAPPTRGALPAGVRDAIGAWNALAELGDVRAREDVARFEEDVAYARLRSDHGDGATIRFRELCVRIA